MRIRLVLAALACSAAPAFAQSLDGSVNSGLAGSLGGGVSSGFQSGLSGNIGSTQTGRTRALIDERAIAGGGCAPGQVSLNNTGCRPARELGFNSLSTYDTSIEAMRPLNNLTLDQTLDAGPGPMGPLN